MAGKITRLNENETVEAEWEALSPQPAQTIEDHAHLLWNRGLGDHGTEEEPIIWEDLVEQDYLDIWFDYLTRVTLDGAKQYVHDAAVAEAREAAEALVQSRHSLGSDEIGE